MNADPRIHDEKQFGIFISYAGKGKIFRHDFFFQMLLTELILKSLFWGVVSTEKIKIRVSKDCRDSKLEKLT